MEAVDVIDSGRMLGVLHGLLDRLIITELDQQLERFGLSRTQYHALRSLRHQGGGDLASLAAELSVSAPATTKLADRLVRGGWILRQADTSDRRRVMLKLTDQADACLITLDDRIGNVLARIASDLTSAEQEQLMLVASALIRAGLLLVPTERVCLRCGRLHRDDCVLSQAEQEKTAWD